MADLKMGLWDASTDLTKEEEVIEVFHQLYDIWELNGSRLRDEFWKVLRKIGWASKRIEDLERVGANKSKWASFGWESLKNFAITHPQLSERIISKVPTYVTILNKKQISVINSTFGLKSLAESGKPIVLRNGKDTLVVKKTPAGFLVVATIGMVNKVQEKIKSIYPVFKTRTPVEEIAEDLIAGRSIRK